MPCYSPLRGWRSAERNENGKRSIVFNPRYALRDMPVDVPCGQCIGCRLERSRQWAVRCVHEASLYDKNCFITLTYDDQHLPYDGSLNLDHFQRFMKRLRKRYGDGIRFFHCGEYGENFGRPHYHACLFNFDFPDREFWSQRQGVNLYTSAALAELWPYGFSSIGDVTFESAAYVARYVMKKVTGDAAEEHYTRVCEITGQIYERKPEYVTMSRRPGIGRGWVDKYLGDVYPSDFVVINGVKCRPPRFYDSIYDVCDPRHSARVKSARWCNAKKHACDNTDSRLLVRNEVATSRCDRLIRNLK